MSAPAAASRLPRLWVRNLGLTPYEEAWALQRELRRARLDDAVEDTVLMVEHPPVITVTRRFGRTHVVSSDSVLAAQGIAVVEVDRGGDVTVHAPGQLVAYPIVKLEGAQRDLPAYVRALEQAALEVLAHHGLTGLRIPGESGVFLAPVHPNGRFEKVCAVGVKGTRFVMSHGLALNVSTALEIFAHVVPCGLQHRGVTSMAARLGQRAPSVAQAAALLAPALARALRRTLVLE